MDEVELKVGGKYVITWPEKIFVTLERIDLNERMAYGRAKDGTVHGRQFGFFESRNLEDEVEKLTEIVQIMIGRIKQLESRFGRLD